jgi:DNA-binding winged helix-turn-helix (wHTH) protein
MEIQKYDYKLGDWCVDLNSASLFTDSQQIHIELKAMEVLQTLVLAKGEVVTREAIKEEVWKGGLLPTTR